VSSNEASYLIINADDFGASTGVNRGIAELHDLGVVTSTSLMVTGREVSDAAALARARPGLSVGLHWDVWGEDDREFDLSDLDAVERELRVQLAAFSELVGRAPSHLDSHRHAHRRDGVEEIFREAGAELGVPVRGDGAVNHVSDFYAQWEWMVTDLEHVSVEALVGVLERKIGPGWHELACHPGYVSSDFDSIYHHEREAELATLSDPAVRDAIAALGIRLASYWDWQADRGRGETGGAA
jgi:predicted glycoside hydrolase/deacetylase ChbG (UPF0249 family)